MGNNRKWKGYRFFPATPVVESPEGKEGNGVFLLDPPRVFSYTLFIPNKFLIEYNQ
jgi:hypothetical protein